MVPVHSITRLELVFKEIKTARRFTDGQSQRAFRSKRDRGWESAMPAEGPPFEMVSFAHSNHHLFPIVEFVRRGQAAVSIQEIETRTGDSWKSLSTLRALAKVGLAVSGCTETHLHLRGADVRAARLINESRHHVSRRGFRDRLLIEAFLPIRDPRRSHIKVKDDRRIAVAEILDEEWDIDAEDLLDGRRLVRLLSRWTVNNNHTTALAPQLV